MPLLDEILDEIGQFSVVSKLDLRKGFYQVPIKLSDREKMANKTIKTSNVLLYHRNGERTCLVNLKLTIGSMLACS